jgi:hypothetical protein
MELDNVSVLLKLRLQLMAEHTPGTLKPVITIVFHRFAKMTPTTGILYNANALATSKNALKTTLGTILIANASAMDLQFNTIMG